MIKISLRHDGKYGVRRDRGRGGWCFSLSSFPHPSPSHPETSPEPNPCYTARTRPSRNCPSPWTLVSSTEVPPFAPKCSHLICFIILLDGTEFFSRCTFYHSILDGMSSVLPEPFPSQGQTRILTGLIKEGAYLKQVGCEEGGGISVTPRNENEVS